MTSAEVGGSKAEKAETCPWLDSRQPSAKRLAVPISNCLLTKHRRLAQYPVAHLRNGSTMILTTDHTLTARGLSAQVCECVSVAKKSKKQSLI